MWMDIENELELSEFMKHHLYFHDSCIKEIKYISGAYVSDDLSMHPVNDKRILEMVIQRQYENDSAIVMQFFGVKCVKIFPVDENYTCELLGATMLFKNGCIYWCDCDDISKDDIENYDGTLVCAEKIRWKASNHLLGAKEIYISVIDVDGGSH